MLIMFCISKLHICGSCTLSVVYSSDLCARFPQSSRIWLSHRFENTFVFMYLNSVLAVTMDELV